MKGVKGENEEVKGNAYKGEMIGAAGVRVARTGVVCSLNAHCQEDRKHKHCGTKEPSLLGK